MQVHQILRAKPQVQVITVAPSSSVADAARLLAERRIGAVIVSDNGTVPLGILSERDIVQLDDERKAAMVSNLLVVLCSDQHVTPVVNTGTLYN